MKSYIQPKVEHIVLRYNGTLCSSEQPSASPVNSGRPSAGAPKHFDPYNY